MGEQGVALEWQVVAEVEVLCGVVLEVGARDHTEKEQVRVSLRV